MPYYYEVMGLVKVTDAETGKLIRWEDRLGKPLAVMEAGILTLTSYGVNKGYLVRENRLVVEFEEEPPTRRTEGEKVLEDYTYDDWVVLAEGIKGVREDLKDKANEELAIIFYGTGDVNAAKEWLLHNAKEFGVIRKVS